MTFYRGFKSKFGFDSLSSFIWITNDYDYACEYGDCVGSVEINFEKLIFATLSVLEDVCVKLNYDYIETIYNPNEKMADLIRLQGYNIYTLEPMDFKCCCLLNKILLNPCNL